MSKCKSSSAETTFQARIYSDLFRNLFRFIQKFIQIYSENYSETYSLFGLAAIAWRKKTFRKYFDSEDNFTEFHKLTHRLLEAPTVEITRLLQDSIEEWLREKGELRAAEWFSTYWTGEHGNYTNATAGYVGSNKSAGIESHWRYTKRDTIGGAGSNKRISLRVFIPSLVQYVKDSSKRHASKILCSKTGAH